MLNSFSFVIIFSFYFGLCCRQSWLNCQLSSARHVYVTLHLHKCHSDVTRTVPDVTYASRSDADLCIYLYKNRSALRS